jgi:hypothetical protein
MKNLIKLLLVLILFSCEENEIHNSNYFRCWREYRNMPGYYDLIITEMTKEPHRIEFGLDCKPIEGLLMDIGIFRNDTLIMDNGLNVYWAYYRADTLYYSAYSDVELKVEKFLKIIEK